MHAELNLIFNAKPPGGGLEERGGLAKMDMESLHK